MFVKDSGNPTGYFHLIIGIVKDFQMLSLNADSAVPGQNQKMVLRVFQNAPVIFQEDFFFTRQGDDRFLKGKIPGYLQRFHQVFLPLCLLFSFQQDTPGSMCNCGYS